VPLWCKAFKDQRTIPFEETPVDFFSFALNVGTALLLGLLIGLERQFRQHPAGLRTNALVCTGAALFVSLSYLMNDEGSRTRIASYIVSGVGFLGGGVILREGMNVKGMSTAATLWCSAAVGTLAGAGFPLHALLGAAIVLGVHLTFRPLGLWIEARRKTATSGEILYQLRVVCQERDEGLIRTILLRHVNSHAKMTTQGISTEETGNSGQATVVADILSLEHQDRIIQEVMSRLNIEPGVKSVSWKKGEQQVD
jgi:putative Mg2+ transporter-C (MgtC) family protein